MQLRELGHGAFGKVYLMRDPADGHEYAVKTESRDARVPQLSYEFKVYRKLLGAPGVPVAYALWQKDERYHLAMQQLGPSLERCLKRITQWDVVNWICPRRVAVVGHSLVRDAGGPRQEPRDLEARLGAAAPSGAGGACGSWRTASRAACSP